MECWDIVERTVQERVKNMKFALERKKDEKGRVYKRNIRLVVC